MGNTGTSGFRNTNGAILEGMNLANIEDNECSRDSHYLEEKGSKLGK